MADSNKWMQKGKGKVTTLESEKESTPKPAPGSSNSSRVRSRKRGSSISTDIQFEDELPLTPQSPLSDTEVFSRVDVFVQDNPVEQASEEQVSVLEAVNNKKETLNRFLAPITCMCGVIAIGGVGFNLSLAQRRRNKLLEASTFIMILCFFLFLSLWILTWFYEELYILNSLERIFCVGLVILLVAVALAAAAMLL